MFLKNSVFSCKVLCKYIVTNFLFIKIIFLSVPYIHYKLIKVNFSFCVVLSLSSWWQQSLQPPVPKRSSAIVCRRFVPLFYRQFLYGQPPRFYIFPQPPAFRENFSNIGHFFQYWSNIETRDKHTKRFTVESYFYMLQKLQTTQALLEPATPGCDLIQNDNNISY